MKNKFETQEELIECIPNPIGVPCHTDDSESLRKEHNRWRNTIKKRTEKKKPVVPYWKTMSSCAAL